MLIEEKRSWLLIAALIALAVFYFLGAMGLAALNSGPPDPYQWRSFVKYLIMFAAVLHVVIYFWFDDAQKGKSTISQRQIVLAKLKSSHYAYYVALSGLVSCVAWFYSPELVDFPVFGLTHIIMAVLLIVLLVKYISYIVLLRKTGVNSSDEYK